MDGQIVATVLTDRRRGAGRGVARLVESVRRDLTAQIGGVRRDLGDQIGHVRRDLGDQIGHVRRDLGGQIGDMNQRIDNVLLADRRQVS